MMANRRQSHAWVAIRPQSLARQAVVAAAALLAGATASADTIYWAGTGTTWSPAGNWSTDPNATTPAPAAVPGGADDLVFNIAPLVNAQVIGLSGADQAARSLTFNSTGIVNFGGGGSRPLAVGAGGITVASTAGAVTIGSSDGSSNVFVRITADQTWTNASANQLRAYNAATATATGTAPVTLTVRNTSTGATTFSNQLNNGAGGAVLALVVDSPGTGFLNLSGGNFSGGTTIKQGNVSASTTTGTEAIILGDATGGDARLNVSAANSNSITVKAGIGLRGLTGSTATADFRGPITLERDVSIGSVSATTQTFTVSGSISGTGNVTVGRLPGGSNSPVVTLSGSNSYPGRTIVDSATLVVSSLNKVVGGSATSNLGAPTTVADGTISLGAVAASTLRYTGTGETTDRVLDLAGATNGVTLEQAGTGLLTFTSNLTTTGNGNKAFTLAGSTAGSGEFAGLIGNSSGTTALTKSGTGTWRLSGLNTYTGNTTISGGVLEVTHLANAGQPSSLGAPTSTVGPTVLNGGGTLRYVGSGDSTNRVLTIGSGGGTLDASGSGAVRFTSTTTAAFGSSGVPNSLNLAGTNSDANTYGANQGNNGSGAFSLVKGGTGTWVLSGASTYTGTTTVSSGTLVVGDGTKGSLGNTAVTVGSGGTLAGTGPIAGSVTVASGGTLSPGNSPGSQAVGSLAWAGGGNYNWQVLNAAGTAGVGYDTYAVSGALDLSALTSGDPFNINLWSLASIGPDVGGNAANFNSLIAQNWTLVATPTPIAGFSSSVFQVTVGAVNGTSGFTNSLAGGSFGVTLGDGGTDLMLSFTPVPEPGSLLLMALAGAAMVSRRRGGRRRIATTCSCYTRTLTSDLVAGHAHR